jgi:alpha-beta hydrolase superfamily lysophospholipase
MNTCRRISFYADGLRLKATLHLPSRRRAPLVIGSHGMVSSAASPKQIALAQACTAKGMAFLRLDHRGCGLSEGTFAESLSLAARCNDLRAALEAVRARTSLARRIGLFGSSMGGSVCIRASAALRPQVIVTYAAPIASRDVRVSSGALAGHTRHHLPAAWRFDLHQYLNELHDILVFHGEADSVVPVAHAFTLFEKARSPKRIVIHSGGDHPMSNPLHQKPFIEQTALWLHQSLFASRRTSRR